MRESLPYTTMQRSLVMMAGWALFSSWCLGEEVSVVGGGGGGRVMREGMWKDVWVVVWVNV